VLSSEPNIRTALGWWGEIPDKWTPVGWKGHLFRFNIEFNGAIAAIPDLNRRTADWKGQGVLLTIYPTREMAVPDTISPWRDDGSVVQGWNDCDAPVLWSEWAVDGLIYRSEVFAHIPGAADIVSGTEPLFAWIRLSVYDRIEELPLEDECGFLIRINAPCVAHSMNARNNTDFIRELALHPRPLRPERDEYVPAFGWRVVEDDGRVRMGIAPGMCCKVTWQSAVPCRRRVAYYHDKSALREPEPIDSLLHIVIPSQKGTCVDLLLPMLPTERDVFDPELLLGYDRALDEANRYWSVKPGAAAVFDTPEDYINQAIRRSLQFAEIIAEHDPATGHYSMLTGSWSYSVVWATPVSMTSVMLLDTMGYHSVADKYLEVFRKEQGTVAPPSPHIGLHPGYLATPSSLTAINWLSDHCAILWSACEHALLSGDEEFIERWTPAIVRACEFIRDARRIEGHGGVLGIMPPAIATDSGTHIQAVWNDGWIYKGLRTAVRLLKHLGHPRAEEFEREAADYRRTFVAAIREKTRTMPTWTDRDGSVHHLVPTSLFGDKPWETRHPFYLDTGPLILVFAGLLEADDELMRSTLLWFREGPQVKHYRKDSNWSQVPSLHHEISSCEPVYSFNVFHSHRLGDRLRFLEGMYSLFAGYVSQQTYTMCEHRGGVCGLTPALVPGYLARLAVVDDQIAEDELHLMRMVPLAWLREDTESSFESIPTEFGPVSMMVRLADGGRHLKLTFFSRFMTPPPRVLLHVPRLSGLEVVTVNGEKAAWDGEAECIPLV